MGTKIKLFIYTAILYGATLYFGIASALRHIISPVGKTLIQPFSLGLIDAIIFIAVFALFTTVMVRFAHLAHRLLGVFLGIIMLAGAQYFASAWMPTASSWMFAIALFGLMLGIRRIIFHDLAIMFGIAGIGAALGASITPLMATVFLALLAIYDIISVYRTRHMMVLAERMIDSGFIFGFLVPPTLRGFFMDRDHALDNRSVMILGSGDVGLPLILATSVVGQSINTAFIVAGSALIGLLLMHLLFLHQDKPSPMAALPPITAFAIGGYLVAILLGL